VEHKSLDFEDIEAFLVLAQAFLARLDALDAEMPAIRLGQAIDEISDWARGSGGGVAGG
jgi:hypothetical protein